MSVPPVTFCSQNAEIYSICSYWHANIFSCVLLPHIPGSARKNKKTKGNHDQWLMHAISFQHVPWLVLSCNNMLSKFVSFPFVILLPLALLSPCLCSEKWRLFSVGKNIPNSPDQTDQKGKISEPYFSYLTSSLLLMHHWKDLMVMWNMFSLSQIWPFFYLLPLF